MKVRLDVEELCGVRHHGHEEGQHVEDEPAAEQLQVGAARPGGARRPLPDAAEPAAGVPGEGVGRAAGRGTIRIHVTLVQVQVGPRRATHWGPTPWRTLSGRTVPAAVRVRETQGILSLRLPLVVHGWINGASCSLPGSDPQISFSQLCCRRGFVRDGVQFYHICVFLKGL